MFGIESCAKQQILIDELSEKRASWAAQIPRHHPCSATSDGIDQKLNNDLWHDSGLIATNVCC